MSKILKKEKVIAYKGFDVDEDGRLYCQPDANKPPMYFEVGKVAQITGDLIMCKNGIHFCYKITDVHQYYNLKEKVICEIEILGNVINDTDMKKSITNKIKVLKILIKEQILMLSNSGKENSGLRNSGNYNSGNHNSGNYNSGNCNSGNCNSGNCNSGNYNSGNCNSGNCNSGNCNSGNHNSGNCNSGNCNSGNCNSGNYNSGNCNSGNCNSGNCNSGNHNSGNCNSGNCNSGDCNSGNYNSGYGNSTIFSNGVFNQEEHKIFIFDIQSDMTTSEFNNEYISSLYSEPLLLTEWIEFTNEEKERDKAKELIGGYLKTYDYKEACKIWWSKLTEKNKKIIQSIPHFDKNKFYQITGIKI